MSLIMYEGTFCHLLTLMSFQSKLYFLCGTKKEDISQNVANQTDSDPIDFNSNFFVCIMETNGTQNCLVVYTHQDIFCVLQKKERYAGLEFHVGK